MPRGKSKPVRCVETGEVFSSAKEAALSLYLSSSAVTNVIVGNAKTAGGYHWEYANEEDRDHILQKASTQTDNPRSRPRMTIYEVQAEALRRTKETGRLVRYSDIQKEETLRLLKEGKLCHTKKRKPRR